MWKYEALYPLSSHRHELELSLGERGTPLVLASKVGRMFGVEKTWFKCDHLNPSGSFKDRSAAAGVAWALEQGYPGVICASSGNAAGASATYAARAGLPVYLVVSSRAPKSNLGAAAAHGVLAAARRPRPGEVGVDDVLGVPGSPRRNATVWTGSGHTGELPGGVVREPLTRVMDQ